MDDSARPSHTAAHALRAAAAPAPRAIGAVNWVGLWTLYQKEVRRFLKITTQTVAAPVVTTLLFLAIFTLALGGRGAVAGVGFSEFLAPGLIMMAMAQNAFANTASSIVISKVQGNIVDLLMPPLSPGEITCAIARGGLTRGLMVGLAVGLAMTLFVPMGLHDPWLVAFYAAAASLMLALLGIVGGIWADKFEHMAAITNFVVTPLTFLSGTFYSIQRLPETVQLIAHANPFFYMIDGFRFGFIGQSDAPIAVGIVVLIVVNVALWAICYVMFASGYKLKP